MMRCCTLTAGLCADRNTHYTRMLKHTRIKNNKFVLLPNAQPINKLNKRANTHTHTNTSRSRNIFVSFRCFRIENSASFLLCIGIVTVSVYCVACCSAHLWLRSSRKKQQLLYGVQDFPAEVNYFSVGSVGETKCAATSRWNSALARTQTFRGQNRSIAFTSNDSER